MSTDTSPETEREQIVELNTAQDRWGLLMAVGAVLAAFGVIAIFFPFIIGVSLSILFGALLIVGAFVHAVHVFNARKWTGILWETVLAIIYLIAGVLLILDPVFGLVTLTIVLIAYLLVEGIAEVILGFRVRPERGWEWVLGSGVISILLAILLLIGWPSTATWALGLLFGVSLFTSGISVVMVAMGGREADRRTTESAVETAEPESSS
ncbi:HdeD family acid-resistance protein [halophilic archaeon]|nr:HdeD family acid-resistance protein [halophilic archaeon]